MHYVYNRTFFYFIFFNTIEIKCMLLKMRIYLCVYPASCYLFEWQLFFILFYCCCDQWYIDMYIFLISCLMGTVTGNKRLCHSCSSIVFFMPHVILIFRTQKQKYVIYCTQCCIEKKFKEIVSVCYTFWNFNILCLP